MKLFPNFFIFTWIMETQLTPETYSTFY